MLKTNQLKKFNSVMAIGLQNFAMIKENNLKNILMINLVIG